MCHDGGIDAIITDRIGKVIGAIAGKDHCGAIARKVLGFSFCRWNWGKETKVHEYIMTDKDYQIWAAVGISKAIIKGSDCLFHKLTIPSFGRYKALII